jgi:hypothetical protein
MSKKITRYAPWITILICGLLLATVVSAQPGNRGGGQGMGRGQGQGPMGPGQGFGQGKGGGHDMMGMFLGHDGPLANPEIQQLMDEIKILGFINRFEFTADQLKAISKLSVDTLELVEGVTKEFQDKMIDNLTDRRDALLKGETPGEFERPGKPEITEERKAEFKALHDAVKANIDAFFDILTDEQKKMIKQGMKPDGGRGGQGGHNWQDNQNWQGGHSGRQGQKPGGRSDFEEDPSELQGGQRGGFQGGPGGPPGGPGGGFGGPGGMMGNHQMGGKIRILEILLNPSTAEVIELKLDYM